MHTVHITPSSSELILTERDIRVLFTPNTLAAGRVYEMRGRVVDLEITDGGATIAAQTQGSAASPYGQMIHLSRDKFGMLHLQGHCTCPVRHGCKHMAAVLVAARHQQQDTLPVPTKPRVAGAAPTPVPAEPLPPVIGSWLLSLEKAEEEEAEAFPPNLRHRLFYVLSAETVPHGVPPLKIATASGLLRKDDSVGSVKPYSPQQLQTPARYLRPSDRLILTRLNARRLAYGTAVPAEDPADTLRRIIATGRARWGSAFGPAVSAGPERAGHIVWQVGADGSQHTMLEVEGGCIPVRIPEPWYADPQTGAVGPVTLELASPVANRMLAAPSIPADIVPQVRAELERRMPAQHLPAPLELAAPQPVTAPMHPHLRLISGTLPSDPGHGRGSARSLGAGLFAVPLARLSFEYGPLTIPATQKPQPRIIARDGVLYEPRRNAMAEQGAIERLRGMALRRVSVLAPTYYQHAFTDDFVLQEGDHGASWMDLVIRQVPALRAKGWTVDIDDAFPLQVITTDMDIAAELEEGSGIDWLELHLGVLVDGERVDLVPAILKLLSRPETALMTEGDDDKPFVLPLQDGRLLTLPLGRIRPMLLALMELYAGGGINPVTGKIGFTRLEAADLARLEEASGLTWDGGEALRSLGRQLREAGGTIPVAKVPATFHGSLRPYQSDGVNWLQFLRAAELGGVLADDMGLGKTIQTLAHLLIEQAEGRLNHPCLIVCPTSLIPNWSMEAARFAPTLKLLALHGPARKERFGDIAHHDLVLTTYPLLTRDHETLVAQEWHAVILDEAQTIKNPNAETTRQALRLKAPHRLCLSGTPLQNHLGELWSLFDFLAPGFLGSQKAFRTHYRTPIEKHGDASRQTLLNRRVRPFLLRRTKEEVAKELPPKTEITESVELETAQRAIYESIRLAMHARVRAAIADKGLARSGIIVLDALLKLRQACCDPRLLKMKAVEKAKAGSAKLDRLMEMLAIMLAEGRRVLIFSQFTEMLALIERALWNEKIEYVMLTGDTKDRATPVKRFQAGEVPVFLISLKAGGVGLNLTAADTVIHYDPWWNPAAEDQATDRAHRIGQSKKVFVHRLVTLGTIEEKMEVLKEKKRALVASVLEAEHGGALKLSEADIDALFAPAV